MPTPHRKLQNLVKFIDVGVRNTCANAQKTLLNCFRDHRHMLCCENTVYKHDFCDNFRTQTVKFPDLNRFWLAMLGISVSRTGKIHVSKVLKLKNRKYNVSASQNFKIY